MKTYLKKNRPQVVILRTKLRVPLTKGADRASAEPLHGASTQAAVCVGAGLGCDRKPLRAGHRAQEGRRGPLLRALPGL